MRKVYLDYNASTPIAPEVRDAMLPFLDSHFGNPSSTHWAGAFAKSSLETSRNQVAELLNCQSDEIVFTSGGTEANNHAIKGVFFTLRERGNHIITTQVEHPAVLMPCGFLERFGAEVTYLPVDNTGMVNPEDFRRAITPRTILASVMHANNEVGTIQPIAQISTMTREHGILLHTDAAQSVGKIPMDVHSLGIDLLTVAGHKLYAPKGVGALFIRRGIALESLLHGAGHESGRRAGTENILLNVALGAACQLAALTMNHHLEQMVRLRNYLFDELKCMLGSRLHLNGHPINRLPNTLNFSIEGFSGHHILDVLPGVAASTGSACHSGSQQLSPVLKAMGVGDDRGFGAVRLSLGRETTQQEIDHVLALLKNSLLKGDL